MSDTINFSSDVAVWGSVATVLVTIAFFSVCFWAFSPKLKKRFEKDAQLPFIDDEKEGNPL
jgi:cytochrome c oxidase cbb3-type subunit IV